MSLAGVLQHPFRLILCGVSRSGKTTTLRQIVAELEGQFNAVIVNSENAAHNPNYDFASHRLEGDATARFNQLLEAQKRRQSRGEKMHRLLLICEDFQTLYGNNRAISRLWITARAYSISLICVCHRLSTLPPQIRDNSPQLILTSRPRPDQMKIVGDHTELCGWDLQQALRGIAVGTPLLLMQGSDEVYFLDVRPEFATRELDDF